jgi:hypothetical protein
LQVAIKGDAKKNIQPFYKWWICYKIKKSIALV